MTNFLVVTHKPTDLSGEVLNCNLSYSSKEQVGCRPSKLTTLFCPTNTPLPAAGRWVTMGHLTVKLFADLIYQKKPSISTSSYKAQKQSPNLFLRLSPTNTLLFCQLSANMSFPCSLALPSSMQHRSPFHPMPSNSNCCLEAPGFINTHECICTIH